MVSGYSEQRAKPRRRSSASTALDVIDTLSAHPKGLPLSEIAELLGLDRAHAHRILAVLVEDSWVVQAEDSKMYRLTSRILHTSGRLLRQLNLRDLARPVTEKLAAETGETIELLEVRDDNLVCVDRINSKRRVAAFVDIGDVVPLDRTTAVGSSVLALTMAYALGPSLDPERPPNGVAKEIIHVLKYGYGVADRTFRDEVSAVGAAIANHERHVIGAIGVVGPADRLSRNDLDIYGLAVAEAARKITIALGGDLES